MLFGHELRPLPRVKVLLVSVCLLLSADLASAGAGELAPQLKLTKVSGPPTTKTTLKGKSFGVSEIVDVTFDSSPLARASTDGLGKFAVLIRIPFAATPGDHTVTATGETSGLTASTIFTVRTDWTKIHFDLANTGFNPYENVIGNNNVSQLTTAWTQGVGGFVDTSPALTADIAYVGSNDANGNAWISAVDAKTGGTLWVKQMVGGIPADPTVANGVLYISELGHYLHAYNASTGQELWKTPGPTGAPVVYAGVVYAGDDYDSLFAIDAVSGVQIWKASTGSIGSGIEGAPAVVGGVVYVGTQVSGVEAFDASTGASLWKAKIGSVWGAPAVVKGVVYAASLDHYVYAIDSTTGAKLWKAETGDTLQSTPAVVAGLVYATSHDSFVYAFNASTGALVWKTPTGAGFQRGSLSIANGVAYVGAADGNIYGFDALTGSVLWAFDTGALMNFSPAIVNGQVYVGSNMSLLAFTLP